ncbi:MAG TPA: CU044_2847 family protein [Agromyces sp.]|jgi:NTP-dependent ternary system trypsin peptidase co-occuring protein|nr:CU044_2847 family protein [Agromyces sp.]
MERLAIFTTADGDEVVVQVADDGAPSAGLTTRGISTGRLIERTEQSLDEVLAHARPAVSALVRQMRGQEDAPDELEVEFGIQISLEVGAYVAAASSTANFRVTMRWLSQR